MLRAGLTAILLLAMSAAASCGGSSVVARGALDGAHIVAAQLDTEASIGAGGAELTLVPTPGGDLELRADGLNGAKVLVGYISYDPEHTRLLGASVDGADADHGVATDDRLSIVVDRPEEGRVHFGIALVDYENREGLSGAATLALLSFGAGPAPQVRGASRAPDGLAKINEFQLAGSLDAQGHVVLTWKETMDGDGDNNTEVNAADIAPIAGSFLAKPDPNATDPASSRARRADYDRNTEVNAADLVMIASQFGTTLGGYQILAGPVGGTLTEVVKFARDDMFPPPRPGTADGELFWEWRSPDPLDADTDFRVRPYDKSTPSLFGRQSENIVTLLFEPPIVDPTITSISIEVSDPDGVLLTGPGGELIMIVTEDSIDGQAGNSEPFAPESLQLIAMAETAEDPGNPIDATELVIWVVVGGGGLAEVSMNTGSRGLLTPLDRGVVTIEAHRAGNFNIKDTFTIHLATIETVTLTSGGSGGPISVGSGTPVPFTATGAFAWEPAPTPGNEVVLDLTEWVNWAHLLGPANTGSFSFDTGAGVLDTSSAASGDSIRVSAEFPRTDDVKLHDNVKRVSSYVMVNIN